MTAQLSELATRIEINGSAGVASSAEIFDAGLAGLDFFERFGPAFASYRHTTFDFTKDIRTRYDAEREIAFAKLRADAAVLTHLSSDLTDSDLGYRNAANSIFSYWQGKAADQAQGTLDGFLSSAGSAWERIAGFADTLLVTCDAAERVVFAKADTVAKLAAAKVGGLTASDVSLLVKCALARDADALDDESISDLASLARTEVSPALCRTDTAALENALADVRTWLDSAFVPFYQARLDVFDAVCARTDSDLRAIWAALSEVMTGLGSIRFSTGTRSPEAVATVAASAQARPEVATPGPGAPTSVAPAVPAAAAPAPAGRTVAGVLGPPAEVTADEAMTGHDPQPEPGNAVGADVSTNDTMTPSMAGPVPVAAPAPVATQTIVTGGGYGYGNSLGGLQGLSGGGGDRDHQRKVTLRGHVVEEPAATPSAVGENDDPLAYNETDLFGDDGRTRPAPPVEPEAGEPEAPEEQVAWRLDEDGELRPVKKTPTKEEQ